MRPLTKLAARTLAALALACASAAALAPGSEARPARRAARQGASAFEARVEGFLRQSGYEYGKVKNNSWYVNVAGKELTRIRVLVGAGANSIAVGAVVVPKARLRVTADSMYKMMKLSYDLNYVRVCIDPDEDLLVMSQVKEPWLSQQEFKSTVERVAAAADRAYAEMRPFLDAP